MNETIQMLRTPESIWDKINPLWWLVGPDGWTVPTTNNGQPYLPDVTNPALRAFYWFVVDPLMNFVGKILGVEDNNYKVVGPAPVLLTTLRDAAPPRNGWKWSVIWPAFSFGALIVAILFTVLAVCVHWAFAFIAAFAALKIAGPLPFVAYWNGKVEAYLGWRPASGGFGAKFVVPK